MDKIRIQNLRFFTYNGVLKEERVLGQAIAMDLELTLPLAKAGKSDAVEDTISYAEVTEKVSAFVQTTSFNLMEGLASGVLDLLEANFSDKLVAAKVKVRKLSVPMPGIYDHIEIEMERSLKK